MIAIKTMIKMLLLAFWTLVHCEVVAVVASIFSPTRFASRHLNVNDRKPKHGNFNSSHRRSSIQPWATLRGGSLHTDEESFRELHVDQDSSYEKFEKSCDESSKFSEATSPPSDASLVSINNTYEESAKNPTDQEDREDEDKAHETSGMIYTAVGNLNIHPPSTVDGPLTSSKTNGKMFLFYTKSQIHETISTEEWGMARDGGGNDSAMAETMGCLCHSIVINISDGSIFLEDVEDTQYLDDVLFSIANGIIRRLKSDQSWRNEEELIVPIVVTHTDGATGDNAMSDLKSYIQGFLNRAFQHGMRSNLGHILQIKNDQLMPKVVVESSDHSADMAASKIGQSFLTNAGNGSFMGGDREGNNPTVRRVELNLVPRTLFGVFATEIHRSICEGNGGANDSSEWVQLSEHILNDDRTNETRQESPIREADPTRTAVSSEFRHKIEMLLAQTFVDAEELLFEIETKMDESFLDMGHKSLQDFPMPEFGRDVDFILTTVSDVFVDAMNEEVLNDADKEWAEDQRIQALAHIAGHGIHRLFHIHMQSLRDHCGRWYEENFLENSSPHSDADDTPLDEKALRLKRQDAARRAEEIFVRAAYSAIPQICRPPAGEIHEELAGKFSCTQALRGLLEDMMEATSARGMEEEEWMDIMDATPEDGLVDKSSSSEIISSRERVGLRQLIKNIRNKMQKRGPAKWYERLAFKALVIGVNYVQGWILLQTLRREAMKRDLDFPKFPLF